MVSWKNTAKVERASEIPKENNPTRIIMTGSKKRLYPGNVPVKYIMIKRGIREKKKLIEADKITESGKIAFGIKIFFIRLLFESRLTKDVEVLWEKKFQRIMPERRYVV